MIASVHGKVIDKDENSVVISLNGLGVQVFAPKNLVAKLKLQEEVFFYTYLAVREDSLTLFGFESKEQLNFFNLLISVNGVGPKLGQTILSHVDTQTIRRAVAADEPELLNRVPGVGKKTAQKILLHLEGKIEGAEDLSPIASFSDTDSSILEALTALGYSVVEAQAALQSISGDASEDEEERLRLALQYFNF